RSLHPGHEALVPAGTVTDPPGLTRRRIDAARFRAEQHNRDSVLIITHAEGGGVERVVQETAVAHEAAGRRAVVLRPANDGAVLVSDGDQSDYPHLRFTHPERTALMRLLRAARPIH